MLTEAIHTPYMQDRALSIDNANYIFNTMADISDEIEFKNGGIIQNRANEVVSKAYELIKEIESLGMFKTIEQGVFAGIKRSFTGGKGLNGVFEKDSEYFNPVMDRMIEELKEN
jgi:beta-lysine 5,6-aminomutase alpha subunit